MISSAETGGIDGKADRPLRRWAENASVRLALKAPYPRMQCPDLPACRLSGRRPDRRFSAVLPQGCRPPRRIR